MYRNLAALFLHNYQKLESYDVGIESDDSVQSVTNVAFVSFWIRLGGMEGPGRVRPGQENSLA